VEYFIHPQGICESEHVGAGTTIWAFAHVLPGAVIGRDCNICDHVFIENDVVLGDRVTVKCGVQLWDGLRVENDVFIGPNATFTNDRLPRSKQRPAQFEQTVLQQGCSIGANATILPGIIIGRAAMVGAGAVVTKSVPPNVIIRGNPATIQGYTSSLASTRVPELKSTDTRLTRQQLLTGGATIYRIPAFEDIRGRLVAGELNKQIPFPPVRFFTVYDVPSSEGGPQHAHHECHQFLICVKGSVHVLVDDGSERQEVVLDRPDIGLHIKPYIWGTQYKYSADAVLLVFASHSYDSTDYIRDYNEWLAALKHS
jgi:acetyltransferase-like isoleucine patch superfamily enzyme